MTTLLFKRMFKFNGQDYIYKMEKTAPNEIQKSFGKITEQDRYNRLDFLPRTGLTHKIEYDTYTNEPKAYEKMHKTLDDFGHYDIAETESVHKSRGQFPYWVTLKGNQYETAYVKTANVDTIKTPNIQSKIQERVYENKTIGYDKIYSNNEGDILKYSYFPNYLDPRTGKIPPAKDELNEENILDKAGRLINRLKALQNKPNHF